MLSSQDRDHIARVKKVAYDLNIPEEVIELALSYTSEYIKKKISAIEIDKENIISEEEFNKRYPIIKLPGSVGYLKPSYRKYKYINSKKENK